MPNRDHRRMRILFTSTSYPSDDGDWRGVFIRHLASSLAARSDITLSVWAPPGPLSVHATYVASEGEQVMLARLMHAGGVSHLLRQYPFRGLLAAMRLLTGLWRVYRNPDTDVYHVNWLQCLLPLPRNGTPLLVSVLGNDMKLLHLRGMVPVLRRAMRDRLVTISPNADWMAQPLREVFGDLATVHPVPFGIGPHWYSLVRKPVAESAWLLVTRLTKRKLGPIFTWGRGLFGPGTGRVLHLLGPMQEPIDVPEWICYHGAATPADLHERWFPQATGLLSLSEHDEGRPQVMLEAMAAGLPIIASRLGAHVDLIRDGVDGFIVNAPDTFAQAVRSLEDRNLNEEFGNAARTRIREQFGTWDDCAARYATQYRRMLEGSSDE